MTQPIDTAYVDIVARDKSLDKLRKDVDKTFDAIDKDVLKHLESVDKAFESSFDDIDKHFAGMAKMAEKSFEDVVTSADDAFKDIDVEIDQHQRRTRSKFTALGAVVGDAFEAIGAKVKNTIGDIFENLSGHVKQLVSGVGLVGSTLGSFATSSPLIALILALIPAIIALAAALSNLIGIVGVLPAGLAVLVSAIVPVVIAFQNFGGAVSALASGDIEKINEAMKKLSPSAASVAREIGNLLPQLKSFQRLVQEAFFLQVRGSATRLITSFLPVLQDGFRQVNTAAGQFVKQLIDMLTTADNLQVFGETFASTARIISTLTGPIVRLFDAINSSVHESLPFVERIAAAFGRALDAFAAFINTSIETGAFDQFIEDAFTTVKELVDLLKASGGLIGTLFAGTEDAGHNLIVTLTDIITKLDEFLQSAQGQQVLRDLSTVVDLFGKAIGAVVTSVILLDKSFRISLKTLELIGRAFTTAVTAIGDFFSRIPGKIEEFQAFLGRIPQAIVDTIVATFDRGLQAIGTSIGLILFAVQVLPGKIVEFISSIPQRVGDALASTGPTILDIFRKAFDDANAFIALKFQEIVAFIQSVPDRIIALGPVFLNAGKNLIQSFMNGFRSVGSFIGDIAGDIVGSVKSFLNRAIDRINSGIAAIDAVLPGSLGRIPRLAQGAVVGARPGGTLATIGEGGEDEAVAPLSTLADMIRKAVSDVKSGMQVNFAAGAISVNFSGEVPTEAQARGVGVAVGNSIAEQMAKRSVRTQVRAA